jgi:hypothetical protein
MSYTEKLQAVFLAIKNTKRQEVPDAVQKKLLQMAATTTAETAPHFQAICDGLKFHAEMLNIPAFSFSPLQINWPSNPQAPLNHYTQAVQHRNAITQQLEKDGVAILLTPDMNGERYSMSMEDMKGRIHPLLMASVKHKGFVDTTFHLGEGKLVQVPTLDTREWDILHTYLPAEALQKIEPFLKRLLLIRPQGNIQNPELKPLWHCDKNGVEHSRGGERVFPVIGGIASSITHEQCNKIAPSLLSYLSNAARKGPTYQTIAKAIQSLLDEHKDAPWTGTSLRQELMLASNAFAGGPIGEHMPDSFLEPLADRLRSYPPAQRKGLLVDAVMRSGVMFNAKASVERKHDPLSLTTPQKMHTDQKNNPDQSQKAPTAASAVTTVHASTDTPPSEKRTAIAAAHRDAPKDPVQQSQEQALLDLFQTYHSSLTAPQLARKFLEVAHPFGLLPLSTEDVRVIDNIIETMKRAPSRAVHGVRWLMDVVRDAQLNMLEQAPAVDAHDQAPRQEIAPGAPRR